MTTPDWAEQKVKKLTGNKSGLLWQEGATLLRAERRRAVRVLAKLKISGYSQFHGNYKDVYQCAINDAIAAVKGEK